MNSRAGNLVQWCCARPREDLVQISNVRPDFAPRAHLPATLKIPFPAQNGGFSCFLRRVIYSMHVTSAVLPNIWRTTTLAANLALPTSYTKAVDAACGNLSERAKPGVTSDRRSKSGEMERQTACFAAALRKPTLLRNHSSTTSRRASARERGRPFVHAAPVVTETYGV